MVHGTFKEVTHMASLHARIPPDTIAMLQLAATCIDIHALSLHIGHVHSRSCRDSLVNQTQVFCLVSRFICLHPPLCSKHKQYICLQ